MVKTRRSESCSVAPENGERCQTDAPRRLASRELGSSCDSVNGEEEQEEDSEQGGEEEDSWSSPEKPLLHVAHSRARCAAAPAILSRARQQRTRFVNGVHSRQGRRSARRRHVKIYPPRHTMRDIMDSDMEDCYSSSRRRSNYKNHQVERRAALSLRPIIQKSYKDVDSAMNCNSDDSTDLRRVRRSRRNRCYANQSWIGDDQMHKVGYPTLNQYTDDSSRDAEVVRPLRKRRTPYHYFSPDTDKNKRGESHDKENKEDSANITVKRSDNDAEEADIRKASVVKKESNENAKSKSTDKEQEEEEEEDGDEEVPEKGNETNKESSSESEEEQVRCGPRLRTRTRKRKLSTSSSEGVKKSYSLRERRAKPLPAYSEHLERRAPPRNRNIPRFNGRRFTRSVSSESDSSDSDRRHNSKYIKTPKSPHSKNEQLRTGGGKIQPIAPETMDPTIKFEAVGGLKEHVQCLKEMVLLPMMYPEVFARFQIQPSKGVLFHGPPGTGKTLLARALANECSFGSKKVSFFMRKGADLLSKWIGESEKQLRVLFEQAAEKKPSIIFFDELDGLAPVRSGRQDQVHASIVSTLLALMDGLTNRGEIIVIGATNRIDAIDPALRRPGRFDRELFFPLPAQKEREEILRVHLGQWTTPPSDSLILYLAESSVGYCGSDLKALCSEAVIQSFRRTYPQVYTTQSRLVLNPDLVKVEKLDFLRAKSVLVPASHRIAESVGNKLNPVVHPLLATPLNEVMEMLKTSFPHGANPTLAKVKVSANVRVAQMLVAADGTEYGNCTYLAPALLHQMEHIHSYVLDLAALHRECGRTPEEACIQIFHEAKRNVPSIIYIPNIDTLWTLVNETVIGIFETQLKQIGPNNPILLLATSDTRYIELPPKLQAIFSMYRNEVYEMRLPDAQSRYDFFKPLLLEATMRPPRIVRTEVQQYEELPRAPTPEPEPMTKEAAKTIYDKEEATLRELRIFLRDMCKKLASNRLFFPFTKPVDMEEVPDYPTIIKEPMDLETMMTKVDFHRYQCAKDFLDDIELICRNALEYNPARTSADKQIRHRACSLRDYAYTLIKSEMDSDFEDKCQEIAQRRQQRNISVVEFLPPYLNTPQDNAVVKTFSNEMVPDIKENVKAEPIVQNGVGHSPITTRVSPLRKRKTPLWARGYSKKRKKSKNGNHNESQNTEKNSSGEEDPKESIGLAEPEQAGDSKEEDNENSENVDIKTSHSNNVPCALSDLLSPSELLEDPLDFDDIDKELNESTSVEQVKVIVDEGHLNDVLTVATSVTKNKPLTSLLDLHFQLSRIIKEFIKCVDREPVPRLLLEELRRYKESHMNTDDSCRPLSALSQISDTCIAMFNQK